MLPSARATSTLPVMGATPKRAKHAISVNRLALVSFIYRTCARGNFDDVDAEDPDAEAPVSEDLSVSTSLMTSRQHELVAGLVVLAKTAVRGRHMVMYS